MSKKKIITACLVVALLAVCAIGGSLAYFTDSDNANNTFTVGNVDISLDEHLAVKDTTTNTWTSYNEIVKSNTYENVYPGAELPKDPTVTNKGANDAWVRVNVTISDAAAFEAAMTKDNRNIDLADIFVGHDENKWKREKIVSNEDGSVTYSYYYRTIVSVGTSTAPIFEKVIIPSAFDNDDLEGIGENFTVNVTADAIQANGFTNVVDAFAAFDAQVK